MQLLTICNCFHDPGGGLPEQTWPGTILVSRSQVNDSLVILQGQLQGGCTTGCHTTGGVYYRGSYRGGGTIRRWLPPFTRLSTPSPSSPSLPAQPPPPPLPYLPSLPLLLFPTCPATTSCVSGTVDSTSMLSMPGALPAVSRPEASAGRVSRGGGGGGGMSGGESARGRTCADSSDLQFQSRPAPQAALK